MAYNLNDTAKGNITMQLKSADTSICIPPKDVYTVNSKCISVDYLTKDNNSLKKQVNIELHKDSLNNAIISNYKEIIKGDALVNTDLQTENTMLTKSLATETKKYKRQKFAKNVLEGVALAIGVYAIIK